MCHDLYTQPFSIYQFLHSLILALSLESNELLTKFFLTEYTSCMLLNKGKAFLVVPASKPDL